MSETRAAYRQSGRLLTYRQDLGAHELVVRLRLAGLPAPVSEYRFAPPRRWRFDLAWPAGLVALEVEGGVWVGGRHVRGSGFERDLEKYNRAALLGWCLLRVTPAQITDGLAVPMIREALQRAGVDAGVG